MCFLDFHHHHSQRFGVYNLDYREPIPECFFSAGIHPKDISMDFENQLNWLKDVSANKNCLAIGECGLDALVNVSRQLQENAFEMQINWANTVDKPIIVHCVRMFSELKKFRKLAKVPMVIHGFNRKSSLADELLRNEFYISFGNALLHHVSLQEIIKNFPINKMFLETDENGVDIFSLYRKVAELKKIKIDALKQQMLENFQNITKQNFL